MNFGHVLPFREDFDLYMVRNGIGSWVWKSTLVLSLFQWAVCRIQFSEKKQNSIHFMINHGQCFFAIKVLTISARTMLGAL